MSEADPHLAQEHAFGEELRPAPTPVEHLDLDRLADVRLTLSAEIGTTRLLVREVLELKRGSVLQLNKLAGELADVHVNGIPFARGEVVVIGDALHIRVAEIIGASDKDLLGNEG